MSFVKVTASVCALADDVVKAQVALSQLIAASGRDAKRRLSYANVGTVRVRLNAAAAGASVDLPRAAPPEPAAQPPARRPGGAAKDTFDLSTFYANDGALADSDSNLIPDRIDVLLSADGAGSAGVVDLAARLGLESTGVAVPIAKSAKQIAAPCADEREIGPPRAQERFGRRRAAAVMADFQHAQRRRRDRTQRA